MDEHDRVIAIIGLCRDITENKVNMRTGRVIGAEALIRWQHPDSGFLPPSRFLPVVEDHWLATKVGEWVIDTALTQLLNQACSPDGAERNPGNEAAMMADKELGSVALHPGP